MWSGPDSACAAEGAPAGNSVLRSPDRSRATQERAQPLPTGLSPGRAGSSLGWGPAQIQPALLKTRQAAGALQGLSKAMQGRVQPLLTGRSGKGVAGPKPSNAGEGAASSYRAQPGSGREPTCVGSGPESACAAEGAPGGKGVARQGLHYAGKGHSPGSPLVGALPSACLGGARQAAKALPGETSSSAEFAAPQRRWHSRSAVQ